MQLDEEEDDKLVIKALIEGLHTVLRPFLLRRCKSEVLKELVPKREYTVLIKPTHQQTDLIKKIMTRKVDENDTFFIGNNRIMQLRKVCNHPSLFLCDDNEEFLKKGTKLGKTCAKIPILLTLLENLIPKGHRVLIFSQMTRVLDILEVCLQENGYTFYRIDGSVNTEERDIMVREFNMGERDLFLLSTRSGGLGLNLASADTVIFYDSDWVPNPLIIFVESPG